MKNEPIYKYHEYRSPSDDELLSRSLSYREMMLNRRSIRDFSPRPVSQEVIRHLIMTAASAPSGANKQPWVFCAVSDQGLKRVIREAAEREEYINYHGRMSSEWLRDLEPLGTHWQKPFLEIAPWLIVMFKKSYDKLGNGQRNKNYYVNESVGIASGFLISAIHAVGLVCLTHTPSPMDFLSKILNRPPEEKAWLLIPVGYPADGVMVPDIQKKREEEVLRWY